MAKRQYQQVIDGEWWMQSWDNAYVGCCDCGLVHRIDSKIVYGRDRDEMALIQCATRDDKETARKRKEKGIRIVKIKRKKRG